MMVRSSKCLQDLSCNHTHFTLDISLICWDILYLRAGRLAVASYLALRGLGRHKNANIKSQIRTHK